jgi:hypothetical protein
MSNLTDGILGAFPPYATVEVELTRSRDFAVERLLTMGFTEEAIEEKSQQLEHAMGRPGLLELRTLYFINKSMAAIRGRKWSHATFYAYWAGRETQLWINADVTKLQLDTTRVIRNRGYRERDSAIMEAVKMKLRETKGRSTQAMLYRDLRVQERYGVKMDRFEKVLAANNWTAFRDEMRR